MACPKISIPLINGLIIMMGGISIGLSLAYPSPTSAEISKTFNLSSIGTTMFNVCCCLCAVFGSVIINVVIPKIGRGYSAFGTGIIVIISYIGIALTKTTWVLFLMRCINGFTVGFFSTICPVFLQEIAPPGKGSAFGFFNQIGLSIGFLIPTIFGMFADYKLIALLSMIPDVILVAGVLFVPEVPHQESVKIKPTAVLRFGKELVIAMCLMFFLQFSGINALLSNLETIITNSKVDVNPSYIALGANLTQILATVISAFVVDKWGKKICWIASAAGQMIAFIMLGVQQMKNAHYGIFMAGLFLEQLTYGIGTGPIPFTLAAQLFPVEVVSAAVGIATGVSWVLSAVICFIWPLMESGLGLGGSFLFFAGISLISVFFGIFVIKGKDVKDGESSEQDLSDGGDDVTRRLSHYDDQSEEVAKDIKEEPEEL